MNTTEIYYPDGSCLTLEWREGTRPAYEWLRRAVGGGPIESVDMYLEGSGPEGDVAAFCNEEGRLRGLKMNAPGMQAVNWPEPPDGWDSIKNAPPPGVPKGPTVFYPGMSSDAFRDAVGRMSRWSPVVGPVIILRGWREEDYDDTDPVNPMSLGEPRV